METKGRKYFAASKDLPGIVLYSRKYSIKTILAQEVERSSDDRKGSPWLLLAKSVEVSP